MGAISPFPDGLFSHGGIVRSAVTGDAGVMEVIAFLRHAAAVCHNARFTGGIALYGVHPAVVYPGHQTGMADGSLPLEDTNPGDENYTKYARTGVWCSAGISFSFTSVIFSRRLDVLMQGWQPR